MFELFILFNWDSLIYSRFLSFNALSMTIRNNFKVKDDKFDDLSDDIDIKDLCD